MTIVETGKTEGAIALECSRTDVKRLYRARFARLKTGGKLSDDGDLAMTLQRSFQSKAPVLGVDVPRHSAWEEWTAKD